MFIPVWGSEISPHSLLSFLKCVVLFETRCIWGFFITEQLMVLCSGIFIGPSVIQLVLVSCLAALCKPWWLVSLLLKHLKIIINGLFFSVEIIYIPVLCNIKMVCYIFATKYYSYCFIWQKALANDICLKYSHTKFKIWFSLCSISGEYLNIFSEVLCVLSLLMQWVEMLIDPMFFRHL